MREDTVVQLRQPGSFEDDPLTEVLRLGARHLLGQAVAAEVAGFVEAYAHLTDSAGRRRIVRHGHLPWNGPRRLDDWGEDLPTDL